MDLVPILSTVILVATIATVLLAVVSYAAFKLRGRRRPSGAAAAPIFFRRHRIEDASAAEAIETPPA